ncbi:cyclic beta-1,2-glucan synthase [Limimaricola soesokkakensis]|uniref:Cyclic beta-1,2-glucan synthase n=1 Tax=Limimaricola soesokkakensis TaxID=1343159 RepID=A0A1X6ZLQ6_9RHOB|nr:glucoamylase family protein [Limimaricola soesokkakensis]PSK85920.1 cyclic beta-1,2-glucan synthase [Limimaricola soesokkakensis]SLN55078.1 N,N'-diacetylchitobiose phosphorylase [Limimaricola soesokkakensis]
MTFHASHAPRARHDGEYLSDLQLVELGCHLAGQSFIEVPVDFGAVMPRRARQLRDRTAKIYRRVFRASQGEQLIGPAEEWLLDNFHLVDENIRQVEQALPPRYVRQLPQVAISEELAAPRVVAFAWKFASHSSFEFEAARLTAMVKGYQKIHPLLIGELWALPSMLRFILVEEFAGLAQRIDRARSMRDRANGLADRIVALNDAPEQGLLKAEISACEDDSFASQLLYRLRDAPERTHAAIDWLDEALIRRGSNAEEVLIAEETHQSAETVLIASIIRSLRAIDDLDWMKWFSSVSRVDAALAERSNFASLDFKSRDQYRNAVEELARQSGHSELEVVERALRLFEAEARGRNGAGACGPRPEQPDIGFWLVGPCRPGLERDLGARLPLKRRAERGYRRLGWLAVAGPILLLTVLIVAAGIVTLSLAGLSAWQVLLLCLLAAMPASEAASGLFNFAASMLKGPVRLVGFAFSRGVPQTAATLLVIPCLLSSRDAIDDLCRHLEVHYLANPTGHVTFALVSDWSDSPTETAPDDVDLLDHARDRIDRLARLYAHDGRRRFHLLHRVRQYNASEGVWMGWERKRGKLTELNLLLRGDADTSFLPTDTALPEGIQYVMTLDSDTRLTRDAVTKLVGKMAHPLNHPVLDHDTGRVTRGWSIMQPRVTPSLTTGAEASMFQRVFSRDRGLDPYVFTVSDTYQDLLGEGSFTGKGLYHVDTVRRVLTNAFGENAILSHDLAEGAIARCALVTDIELIEDFPTRYEVEAARQHRWARGDVQLLPLILSRSGIGALGRWKMVDNLRRILVPIFWIAASVSGWLLLEPVSALVWQSFLTLSLFVAPTLQLIRSGLPPAVDMVTRTHLRSLAVDVAAATAQVGLRILFIPHAAALMSDAAIRSLYRVLISRRNLLEWRSAGASGLPRAPGLLSYYRIMLWPALALLTGLPLLYQLSAPGLPIALGFGLAWSLAPAVAWYVSRSAETEDRLDIDPADRAALRRIARRTWEYFDRFVTEEHNWLPPDNFQEDPEPVVAGRTSPTNIGLYLLATVSARDFGWIALRDCIERIEHTLATIESMETLHGHLYNWYDTRSLAPLLPQYVSTVDSGNLAGHLVTLSAALRDWGAAPYVHLWTGVEGIGDIASILREELADVPDDRRTIRPLRQRLEERLAGFERALETVRRAPEADSVRTHTLLAIAEDIDNLALGFSTEYGERAVAVRHWAMRLKTVCEAGLAGAPLGLPATEALRERLERTAEQARRLAFSMDFTFLMQPDQRLLSIGYNPAEGKLDTSCYDLLASEARLTSLFAVAKGDLPNEHWFRLGRQLVSVGARGALMSWSGSMFEYLMPPLVMQERTGGLLNQSNMLSVKAQIDYGRRRRVPWGVSEAAYNARDREMTYQYSNFGVPLLGLKRGLASDLVVAPYASLLASQYRPRAAVANLERLRGIGARGDYGFYDAVDFTPARLPEGARHAVVRTYMAHHQGMSIVAVANVVSQGLMRTRFHSDPVIEAAELLLQERSPHEVPVIVALTEENARLTGSAQLTSAALREIDDPARAGRAVNLLSNGHYSVMLTATGAGSAAWNGLAVTRFRPDPVEQVWGSFLFLRDLETGDWWSATAAPRAAPDEKAHAVFSDSKAEFYKTVGTLRSRVDVIVASEVDAEGRALTLCNDGETDRIIEVTSYAEPVIASAQSDAAHPVFSKMFIRTEIAEAGAVIHAWRNKRSPDEPDMHVAHLLAGLGGGRVTSAETDRRRFIGRGRTLRTAMAFDPGASRFGGAEPSDGYTLDPILSLRRKVRVPAGKEIRLVFWTLAAPGRAEAEASIARYMHPEAFDREAMHAWTRSQIHLHHVGVDPAEAAIFQVLAASFVLPDRSLGAAPDARRLGAQSMLWRLSISGDAPILTIRIDAEADIEVLREALRAHEYLRSRGLLIDLVILNEHATSYAQDLQMAIEAICASSRHRALMGGGLAHVFALRRDLMDEATCETLLGASRAVFHARNGRLSVQLGRAARLAGRGRPDAGARPDHESRTGWPTRREVVLPDREQKSPEFRGGEGLEFWNGIGGFDVRRREYVIYPEAGVPTPHPWINVIANTRFGIQVSADGAVSSWSVNSRDHQLTPWSNDPVIDRPGEAIYVVDRDTGTMFNPLPRLDTTDGARFEARHGMGYSQFRREGGDLAMTLTHRVAAEDPVRLSRLELENTGERRLRLRITGYAEWVLGHDRARTAPFVTVRADPVAGLMTAFNPFDTEFPGRVAFLACSEPVAAFTADRSRVLGRGDVWRPEAVMRGQHLGNDTETHGDPCAAIATDVVLEAGQRARLSFLLGDGADAGEVQALARRHLAAERDSQADPCDMAAAEWAPLLDTLQIETPDPAMDLMVNAWLPYQGIVCRLRARSAFYQASGAFGFRDQLQDTLAFLWQDAGLARRQILNAAGRQFIEGDFQHWWLPQNGAGVRTTISDDCVWLAYGLCHYVEVTGDVTLLDEDLPFLSGPPLPEGAHDAYFQPDPAQESASVYEHAALGLDLAISRTGSHGLPLILGGDWNDGMNRVGEAGRGESVWLGWFLAHALDRLGAIASQRGDDARAAAWAAHSLSLREALDSAGWDGAWYRRGYYDNGTPLGSATSEECRIDSIAQSWSVMSGLVDPVRGAQAMASVLAHLPDREAGLIRLFTPPFTRTPQEPGYIKGYPPGVRENGGQYTHAAAWVVYALAEMGQGEAAHECFSMLNPIRHTLDPDAVATYRTEPYAVAADIYSEGERRGRGGWTWYTGSAGWLYRAAVEGILGIRKSGDRITVRPNLPAAWPGFVARLKIEGAVREINVTRSDDGSLVVKVDGTKLHKTDSFPFKPNDAP